MNKIVYVTLAAVALWGAYANAHAASPVVAGDYDLWNPAGLMFLTAVITSPNGLAVFHWGMFESEANLPRLAVMKNAGEPLVVFGIATASLNRDWSKIAVGRVLRVSGAYEGEREFADDVEKVAREIGVQPEEAAAATYGDGFKGELWVSRPVIVDLETGAETPLAVAGGDFLYWLDDDELVIGSETSGGKCVGFGSVEAIKYDVRNGEREAFPSEDLRPLLNERCTALYAYAQPGSLNPPYFSKDWRSLQPACCGWYYKLERDELEKPAPPVAVPSRGGQFENDEGAIYWITAAGGPAVKVAAGEALAASDDGVWLFVVRFDDTHDSPWPERFYGLRLTWR
ncbi:MAG: hypothetical protein JSW52_04175 [Candidatus Coatesbacteria bacterium]|nr:MAG: hypothetical protein JSW52_04175 [Candidatus Coatesbacteria bacterium]